MDRDALEAAEGTEELFVNLQFVRRSQTPVPVKYISFWMEYVEKQLFQRGLVGSSELAERELIFVFLGVHSMRILNKRYRGRDRVTDVLSFPPTLSGAHSLGELVFCPQRVKRQAKQNRHSYRRELAYLSLHGLLHLLGFEHENGGEEATQMYGLQDSIFFDFIKLGRG